MNEFDIKALHWDTNPIHIERSKAIALILPEMIPLKKEMKVLEYGVGTGLLSFFLNDQFAEITLMDSSAEMIRICKEKIASAGVKHMKTILIDLEKEDFQGEFDMIYNQMVFHHVTDIKKMIGKFYTLLKIGGYLAIADLYPEDGSFHGEDVKVHKGFDVENLGRMLEGAGFRDVRHRTCFIVKRKNESGSTKEYLVFLMIARKVI